MMEVYFDVIARGDADGHISEEGKYIIFRKIENSPQLPPNLLDFVRRVQIQNIVVLDTFARNKEARSEAMDMLLRCARLGALGGSFNIELGLHELTLVERQIMRGATRARSHFVFSVYGWSLVWLSAAALGFLVLYQDGLKAFGPGATSFASILGPTGANLVTAFLFALIGIAVAVSISATMRLRTITRDILGRFDPYNFLPFERLAYVTLLALGIMIILYFPVIKLGVGDVLLNDYPQQPALGLLVGLLAGASEPILASFFEQALRPQQAGATPAGPAGSAPMTDAGGAASAVDTKRLPPPARQGRATRR